MKNKTVIVTGATGGIGEEIALQLAKGGSNIIMINRSESKSKALKGKIQSAYPQIQVDYFICDLSSTQEIRATIKTILNVRPTIFALINNAGVLFDEEKLSPTGNDLHFQINVLAASQLMIGLKLGLKKSAQRDGKATIINVSSNAIFMSKPLTVNQLKRPQKHGTFTSYPNSKLAITVLSGHMAQEFVADGIDVFAVDPGGNRTAMTASKAAPFFIRWFKWFLPSPSKGANYILAPLLDKKFKAKSGSLISSGKVKSIPKKSNTIEKITELMNLVNREIES